MVCCNALKSSEGAFVLDRGVVTEWQVNVEFRSKMEQRPVLIIVCFTKPLVSSKRIKPGLVNS